MKQSHDTFPVALGSLKDLNLQQTQFVTEFIELGGRTEHGVEAALRAGYATNPKDAKRRASVLLSSPKIIGALKGEVSKRFGAAAALAVNTLVELCQSGPPAVRLSASQEILSRAIGPIVSKSAVAVAHTTIEDLLARLDTNDATPAEQTTIDHEPAAPTQPIEEAELVQPRGPEPASPQKPRGAKWKRG